MKNNRFHRIVLFVLFQFFIFNSIQAQEVQDLEDLFAAGDFNTAPINFQNPLYVSPVADISLKGRGAFKSLVRYYSPESSYNSILTSGWSHSYNLFLTHNPGRHHVIKLFDKDLKNYFFLLADDGVYYPTEKDRYESLEITEDNFYRLKEKGSERVYVFYNERGELDANKRLISIESSPGQTISLFYDGFKLLRVENEDGHFLEFTYSDRHKLTAVEDDYGRQVSYDYETTPRPDGIGFLHLASVDYNDGSSINYLYNNDRPSLREVQLENNISIHYNIDENNVIRSIRRSDGSFERTLRYLTQEDEENLLALDENFEPYYILTDAQGNETTYYYNSSKKINRIVFPDQNEISFEYDENDWLIARVLEDGSVISYQRDNVGRITQMMDPLGNQTRYHYQDDTEKLKKIIDSEGNELQLGYGTLGILDSITTPVGHQFLYRYDEQGFLLKTIDALGNERRFEYDDEGLLSHLFDPEGNQKRFFYEDGVLNRVRDELNHDWHLEFDSKGRLVSSTNPLGGSVSFERDDFGNVTQKVSALGHETLIDYFSNGRPAEVIDPLGNHFSYDYDLNGNLNSYVNPLGHEFRYSYDNRNRLSEIEFPNQTSIQYSYQFNRLSEITDQSGNAFRLNYNPNGLLESLEFPEGQERFYEYNSQNKLVQFTDQNGDTIEYAYDPDQRIVEQSYNNQNINLNYDANGRLIEIQDDQLGSIFYDYNSLGQMTGVENFQGLRLEYAYDARGDRRFVALEGEFQFSYDYDEARRLVAIRNNQGEALVEFDYNLDNQLTSKRYLNGIQATYDYNEAGLLIHLIWSDENGQVLEDLQYEYNNNYQLVSETRNGLEKTYSYDLRGQLVSCESSNGQSWFYDYDEALNRVHVSSNGEEIEYEVQAPNQYSQVGDAVFEYDNRGNLIRKEENGEIWTYDYDVRHRLTSVSHNGEETLYNYDFWGRRISKTDSEGNTVYYLWDHQQLLAELDEQGQVLRYYLQGQRLDDPLLMVQDGESYFYLTDYKKSVIGLQGSVQESYDYSPFGQRLTQASEVNNPFYFAGALFDESTGFYHLRYREYSPELGRFLIPDHPRFYDGNNIYAYVLNDPINYIDPRGTYPIGMPVSQDPPAVVSSPHADSTPPPDLEDGGVYNMPLDLPPTQSDPFSGNKPTPWRGGDYFPDLYFGTSGHDHSTPVPGGIDSIGSSHSGVSSTPGLGSSSAAAHSSSPYTRSSNVDTYAPAPNHSGDYHSNLVGDAISGHNHSQPVSGGVDSIGTSYGGVSGGGGGFGGGASTEPTFLRPPVSSITYPRRDLTKIHPDLVAKITIPQNGSLVRADVPIFGLAYGKDFSKYTIEFAKGVNPKESDYENLIESSATYEKDVTPDALDDSTDEAIYGNLGTWPTGLTHYFYPPGYPMDYQGLYTIRLRVYNEKGEYSEDKKIVEVGRVLSNVWPGVLESEDKKFKLELEEWSLKNNIELVSVRKDHLPMVMPLPKGYFSKSDSYLIRPGQIEFSQDAQLHLLKSDDSSNLEMISYDPSDKTWKVIPSESQGQWQVASIRSFMAPFTIVQLVEKLESAPKLKISRMSHSFDKVLSFQADLESEIESQAEEGHFFTKTFESSYESVKNLHQEEGATLSVKEADESHDSSYLRLENKKEGGSFAAVLHEGDFDIREYPLLKFDIRASLGTKINLMFQINDRWYDYRLSDDPKAYQLTNMRPLGESSEFKADGQWQSIQIDLLDLLEDQADKRVISKIVLIDWDETGLMKLSFGSNPKGATIDLDNFILHSYDQDLSYANIKKNEIQLKPIKVSNQKAFYEWGDFDPLCRKVKSLSKQFKIDVESENKSWMIAFLNRSDSEKEVQVKGSLLKDKLLLSKGFQVFHLRDLQEKSLELLTPKPEGLSLCALRISSDQENLFKMGKWDEQNLDFAYEGNKGDTSILGTAYENFERAISRYEPDSFLNFSLSEKQSKEGLIFRLQALSWDGHDSSSDRPVEFSIAINGQRLAASEIPKRRQKTHRFLIDSNYLKSGKNEIHIQYEGGSDWISWDHLALRSYQNINASGKELWVLESKESRPFAWEGSVADEFYIGDDVRSFKRAITHSSPESHIIFNLENQNQNYQLSLKAQSWDLSDSGSIKLSVLLNDELLSTHLIKEPQDALIQLPIVKSIKKGENKLTLRWLGGSSWLTWEKISLEKVSDLASLSQKIKGGDHVQ